MNIAPSLEDARANATYDALLWSLSRPGQIRTLPEIGAPQLIEALLDRECQVHSADLSLAPKILGVGAELVQMDHADHVFLGEVTDLSVLSRLRQGSDLYPDDGATAIVSADLSQGAALRLSGPGVDGTKEVWIGGLPDGFWQTRQRIMRYPMGFELFLIDGARIMGVPRSTHVEVL